MEDDTRTPPVKSETPEAASGTRAKRRLGRGVIALGVVALALVLAVAAVAVPIILTLQPSYYDRYPELSARIGAWHSSTHARSACADCHVDPGTDGMVAFAQRAVPAFYSQLISGPQPNNLLSAPDNVACLTCHTADRTVSPSGDLLIPHNTHVVKLRIRCADCHRDLVHSLNAKGFNTPEMAGCLVSACHDGVAANDACATCHTRKDVPANHKTADWLDVHPAMVDKMACAVCHAWSPNYCATCHSQRPPSHAGNWKHDHQFRAADRGTKDCLFCHEQAFCDTCH